MDMKDQIVQAIGWTWAEACSRTDKGEDVRQVNIPLILERAKEDGIVKDNDV